MKLFTVGPVEMHPYVLEMSKEQLPYFRTPEFSEVVFECEKYIKEFAKAKENDRVAFLTCSGTGAMEASVLNCLNENDNVLVIDGGSFGHRFCQICETHGIPHEVLKLSFGEKLTYDKLKEFEEHELTALLVNIHETSTCQLYDIEMLGNFCKRKGMYFIVDAISSFLADEFDFAKNGVDVMIASSQKALALAPGLSFVIISERMYQDRIKDAKVKCMYLDFNDHLKNGLRGQTPFTPAVGIILQLQCRLRHIAKQGIDAEVAHVKNIAQDFRNRLKELPVRLPEYDISNACTPIIFENGGAYDTYTKLKEEYGLVITPNGGELADTVTRVGHIGYHTIEDNIELIFAMKKVMLG